MSNLQARLERATAVQVPVKDDAPSCVPYDCIRDYLETHQLVSFFGISSRDLHAALLHVERYTKRDLEEQDTPTPSPVKRPFDCTECKSGYIALDAREGIHVCCNCGVVPHHGTVNVEREWFNEVNDCDLAPQHLRTRYIPGVPKWMVDKHVSDPRSAYERAVKEDMENMNGYMNLTPDSVALAHRTFLRWTENGYSRDVKMAACMFHVTLQFQFMSNTSLRNVVNDKKMTGKQTIDALCKRDETVRIPQVVDPTPKPAFPCRCGVLHYTMKTARYHTCRVR